MCNSQSQPQQSDTTDPQIMVTAGPTEEAAKKRDSDISQACHSTTTQDRGNNGAETSEHWCNAFFKYPVGKAIIIGFVSAVLLGVAAGVLKSVAAQGSQSSSIWDWNLAILGIVGGCFIGLLSYLEYSSHKSTDPHEDSRDSITMIMTGLMLAQFVIIDLYVFISVQGYSPDRGKIISTWMTVTTAQTIFALCTIIFKYYFSHKEDNNHSKQE